MKATISIHSEFLYFKSIDPPMPNKNNKLTLKSIAKVYNSWASIYDYSFGIISEQGRRELAKEVTKLNPENILEVGVGTGLLLPKYPHSCKITGIDISKDMLNIARKRVVSLENHANIELSHSNAEHLKYPDNSFDCVVVAYVLSVTPHPSQLISEIRRVCKTGGTILIVNHFSGSNFWRLSEVLVRNFAKKIGFRSEFSYQEHVLQHNWQITHVKSVNLFGLSKLITIKNVSQ